MPTPTPAKMGRRAFQTCAALTLDRQAGVIGELVAAINQTNEQLRVTREFLADLSVRMDTLEQRFTAL